VFYDVLGATKEAHKSFIFFLSYNFSFYKLKFLSLLDNELVFKLLPKTDGVNMFTFDTPVQKVWTIAIPRVVLVKNVVVLVARLRVNCERRIINLARFKALFNHRLPAEDAGGLLRGCVRMHFDHFFLVVVNSPQ
jgi:hypothetical protein